MKFKAVIWDVDGTLIHTRKLYPEAYRRALAPFVGRELSDEELFTFPSHSELGFLRHHAGQYYEDCVREFQRHYAELHATHFGGIYDGVLDTLAQLRARRMKLGIVTGKSRSSYELVADQLGQFDVLVMDDDVIEPKPHPEGIVAAVNALGIEPGAALYVGDSITDIMAAEEAGTAAGAALWSKEGTNLAAFLERMPEHPDAFLLERPEDVLEIL